MTQANMHLKPGPLPTPMEMYWGVRVTGEYPLDAIDRDRSRPCYHRSCKARRLTQCRYLREVRP